MKLVLLNNADKVLLVDADIKKRAPLPRLISSFRSLTMILGLAFGSVFIPVFHFVLVPTFLVLAVAMFFKTYQYRFDLKVVKTYCCLVCSKDLIFPTFTNDGERLTCKDCFEKYKITFL